MMNGTIKFGMYTFYSLRFHDFELKIFKKRKRKVELIALKLIVR